MSVITEERALLILSFTQGMVVLVIASFSTAGWVLLPLTDVVDGPVTLPVVPGVLVVSDLHTVLGSSGVVGLPAFPPVGELPGGAVCPEPGLTVVTLPAASSPELGSSQQTQGKLTLALVVY